MAESSFGTDRIDLGEIDSARSRHMWTRSSVHLTDDLVVVGRENGTVTAYDRESLAERWAVDHPGSATGMESGEGAIVVAGRGERGSIAAYDLESGERKWDYETALDVGEPASDDRFALPYVVDLATDTDREVVYAAARRYERTGQDRRWHSTVYALEFGGEVRWRYETDASPIAIDVDDAGDRLAVGFNRCLGDHDVGLVVLEPETGEPHWQWDPGTDGDRRVGDVAFDGDRLAVASHGDKRGYLLGQGGEERWRVDLAVETEIGDETLYAYPNHVHATDGHVAFVTGNTYALESHETESRHPNEHRIAVFDADGERRWAEPVRGFVHELAADGGTVVVPCAQNFRVRDPATHAIHRFDLETGDVVTRCLDGIATAVSLDGETIAAIEEPVVYHDEERVRGEYALQIRS
ncbi:PQQ-binding-like beta-propeller repeat protein [Natrialba sp. INN-245]|uniref:outer membrane protein assembly factor BamB family protein n=1 Tax=Natrialba sp. INN-245 TaxID=2690967 RepID=UPI001F42BB1B|nr:PQQ-binding-like beta-propeller repeat protein [Natrialba sp. INN-245]